jgi:hypothetical protein
MTENYNKPNGFIIVLAGLVDATLFLVLFAFLPFFTQLFVAFVFYRFLTITSMDATLGMQVFKLRFLSGEQKALSLKEKVLAAVFVLYEGVDYYKINRSYQ